MVGICTRNDRTKHDGFVWLVLEVPIPEFVELRTHLLEFFLGRTNLQDCVNG